MAPHHTCPLSTIAANLIDVPADGAEAEIYWVLTANDLKALTTTAQTTGWAVGNGEFGNFVWSPASSAGGR
jgi:hypothetical protein